MKVFLPLIRGKHTHTGPSTHSVSNSTQNFLERLPLGTLQVLCAARGLSCDNEAQEFTDCVSRLLES